MKLYVIKLKNYSDKYVAKKDTTYAIQSDQEIAEKLSRMGLNNDIFNIGKVLQVDAHWFTNEMGANVYADPRHVKMLFARAVKGLKSDTSFDQYEVVEYFVTDKKSISPMAVK